MQKDVDGWVKPGHDDRRCNGTPPATTAPSSPG
jgi:hypothetical protein